MTKLSQLKIDPEFQNQINPPSFEETHQLEMNILKEERVLNPIITWNGYIVDGHTRYQILRKYPFIPFEVIEKEFSSRYEALVWICKNQLGRRNLTPEQKKFLIGKQAEAEKQIKSFHGNQYTLASESGLVQNEPDRTKHGSRSKVAAEHGTSESYVYRAEQFAKGVEAAEEAVPGAQKEILSGKIRATDREISSIAKVPKEKRPEVVAELRKPKGERDPSITDSYSSPSKGNEFITTFKQDIQGHKKGLNKEEKQNLKDTVKSIYSPRRLADGEAMMCEIQGAQEDFVRRWEMCFREYPDILTEPKNNEKLLIFIDRASRYFGMERGTEYALEQIYNIVDNRYRSRKPLIVTTNLTLDEIRHPQDTTHARIYDRLLEMCVPVSCIGVSFRKETAQEKLERLKILIE